MKKICFQIICVYLVIMLVIPPLSFTGFAEYSSNVQLQTLKAESVPEYISYESAVKSGHVQRMFSEEKDMYTAVFKNDNNTRTKYVFNEKIKYIDNDGNIQDKSNVLSRFKDGSYRNSANEVIVVYPDNLSKGIEITTPDFSLKILPEGNPMKVITATLNDVDKVVYNEAFGQYTQLKYTQTFTGFKEDIILGTKTSKNAYSFNVLTNGCAIEVIDGFAVLIKEGELLGNFGKVYAYDSNNVYVNGSTTVREVTPNQRYILTISVSQKYLLADTTTYPVVIDPSFNIYTEDTIYHDVDGDGILEPDYVKAIQDASIFKLGLTTMFKGNESELYVGNYDLWQEDSFQAMRGIARTVVKFPYLDRNQEFMSLYNAGQVISIKYNFCDVDTLSSQSTIYASMLTRYWSETNANNAELLWDAYSLQPDTPSVVVTPAPWQYSRYEIELKEIVDWWFESNSHYGVMLRAEDELSEAILLGSNENINSSYTPYLKITYITYPTTSNTEIDSGCVYRIVNTNTSKAITHSTNYLSFESNSTASIASEQRFKFEYNSVSHTYKIIPFVKTPFGSSSHIEQCLGIYNGTLQLVTKTDNVISQEWYMIPHETSYILHNKAYPKYIIAGNSSLGSLSVIDVTSNISAYNYTWNFDFVNLDIPLYMQQTNSTCGSACASMILNFHGFPISETTVKNHIGEEYYTYIGYLKNAINHYLNLYSKNITYEYKTLSDYRDANGSKSYSVYANNLVEKIQEGCPIMALIKVNNTTYFPYTTSGHYVVITGVYLSSSNEYMALVNDPHYDYCAEYVIPLSAIYTYSEAHSAGGYFIQSS